MTACVKKATGYTASPHQGHFGNVSVARLTHVFDASDKEGDVIRLGRFGFDKAYLRVELISKTGIGGATVDLGIHSLESDLENPTFFMEGAAVKKDECTVKCGEWDLYDFETSCTCEEEVKPDCAPERGELHEIIMTIKGTPAEKACLTVRVYYEDNR